MIRQRFAKEDALPSTAKIVHGQDQKSLWLLTDLLTPLLSGDDTAEHLAVSLSRLHPGGGTPPHIHRREDEGFYVLEGEVTFLYGDQLLRAGPGTFVWGGRGVIHGFKCTSSTPGKMLMMVSPTHFSKFAAGFARPGDDFNNPPPVTEETLGKVLATAPQFGIEMKLDHPLPNVATVAAGPMKRLWVMGEQVNYLATSNETAGAFTIVELITAPAGGPPPHTHTAQDEIFYIVDGQHEVLLGDKIETAGPGDLVFIPRGTRHRYSNAGSKPGKLLSIHTPGGFEKFFDEVGTEVGDSLTAPQLTPPAADALAALLERHGMTM